MAFFAMVLISNAQNLEKVAHFQLKNARQGVAVDQHYFYVINNSSITKHIKENGNKVGEWNGKSLGVKHLNSGIIINDTLYCANSNYPESPMASSIEIFDPNKLKHIGSYSFGINIGSATWIDRKDGFWYVGFAHYSGKNSSEGRDSSWTQVIKFDNKWRRLEGWMFPKNIIELFKPSSNSGATWVDDQLYMTGHNNHELYVMELPEIGYELKYIKTLKMPAFGQGIAIDTTVKGKRFLYGIIKATNEVIVAEIKK
jgi:hypothetical protein